MPWSNPMRWRTTAQTAAKEWASLPGPTYAGQVTQVRGARIAALEAAIAADRAAVGI